MRRGCKVGHIVPRYARVSLRGTLDRPGLAKEILMRQASDMAGELADFGAERMRGYIKDRGTNFSSAAAAAGINKGPGRIRTGNMYDSVKARRESGSKKTLASFGWLGNFEEYFTYQEVGFKNIWIAMYSGSGNLMRGPNTPVSNGPIVRKNPFGGYKKTPGMFALRDARMDAESQIPRLAKKYKARITRELNG